jgi:histidinol dehydrogenase
MESHSLQIRVIDTREVSVQNAILELRAQLSPRGDVVSESSRQRTIDVFGSPLTPLQVVERICAEVRDEGTAAVLRYSSQLDKADLSADQLRVPAEELQAAHAGADPEFLETIRRIRPNVLEFQSAIPQGNVQVTRPGVRLTHRYLPLRRAGICVPGGAAAYPSTVLMTAVPAQAAGVRELAVVVPPTPFGAYNRDLLATCHEIGVDEVYRVGGVQAVAALAYGIPEIPRVDKIVGPGNLFVALAKKHVFGEVGIDSIAGPSEVVVLADDAARPDFIAADLLAQAEHAPGASILITWSDDSIARVSAELQRQVAELERCPLTIHSLESFGALIRVRDAEEACQLCNEIAPEHLHVMTSDPREFVDRITNVGAMFLGAYSPVALGDYAAGPSHVLPTGGTAQWASGLSANDFLRSGSVIEFEPDAFRAIAPDVQRMATVEGLTAHRASIDIRMTAPRT